MIHELNPILNKKEQELLNDAPEECLRHAVGRDALSLDQITAALSPQVAAAVRSIVTGERFPTLDPELGPELERDSESEKATADQGPTHSGAVFEPRQWVREALLNHPQLARMLDKRILTPDEALETATAIDHTLGRYLTGTRYAAP